MSSVTFDSLVLSSPVAAAYFFLVSSITPGPNNIMLAASGMNFGFRRSVPHVFGISLGLGLLVVLCGIGVGALYTSYPEFRTVLKILGSAYLAYLAYRIATSESTEFEGRAQPLRWHEAMTFQLVNPKVWFMALTSSVSFMGSYDSALTGALSIAAIAFCVSFPCLASWAVFGRFIAGFLKTPKLRKVVNFTLGGLLVAIIPYIVWS